MKSSSLAQIRKELRSLSREEVIELCEKLAKYKQDNKEYLNYLLFDSFDEDGYAQRIKHDVAEAFNATNTSGFYLAKKSIRRALRIANKYTKYSNRKETEIDVLIFFCEEMRSLNLDWKKSKVLVNLYHRQLVRVNKLFQELHEDLQFEFSERIRNLQP
ncbi:MAG: hypothetical protein H6603_11430 [Flavobacteriales bacterium]|nr:hypothetical protein [Flavobacteriales bacterium]